MSQGLRLGCLGWKQSVPPCPLGFRTSRENSPENTKALLQDTTVKATSLKNWTAPHTCSPSIWEAKTKQSKSDWSTKANTGKPGLPRARPCPRKIGGKTVFPQNDFKCVVTLVSPCVKGDTERWPVERLIPLQEARGPTVKVTALVVMPPLP